MRIALIGHTVGIRYCIEACKETAHEVVAVFTHPRVQHEPDLELFRKRSDVFGDLAYNVFQVPEDFVIPLHEYQDLKQPAEIAQIKSYDPDVVVTVGCRDVLSSDFIASFPFVINLHPFFLPVFRGAGIDSWMILMGASGTDQFATAHFVRPRLDAGEIIVTKPYRIPQDALPIDIFRVRISLLGSLLIEALDKLQQPAFEGTVQPEETSRYFPRLNTLRDGHIRISEWSGEEIEKFIRAFSYPYPGAWLTLGEARLHILRARFTPDKEVHPFSCGLIYRKTANGFFCFVRGGSLEVSAFETESPTLRIRTGHFLK
jgi:methionyl-tRNA formyltransferase